MDTESESLRELFPLGPLCGLAPELTDVPGGVRLDFVVRQNFYINRCQLWIARATRRITGDFRASAEPGRDIPREDMKEALTGSGRRLKMTDSIRPRLITSDSTS